LTVSAGRLGLFEFKSASRLHFLQCARRSQKAGFSTVIFSLRKAKAVDTLRHDNVFHALGEISRYVQCQTAGSWVYFCWRSEFHEQSMDIYSAFRSLALLSLSVDPTEERLLRSHLELFSREHVWGPRATQLCAIANYRNDP